MNLDEGYIHYVYSSKGVHCAVFSIFLNFEFFKIKVEGKGVNY